MPQVGLALRKQASSLANSIASSWPLCYAPVCLLSAFHHLLSPSVGMGKLFDSNMKRLRWRSRSDLSPSSTAMSLLTRLSVGRLSRQNRCWRRWRHIFGPIISRWSALSMAFSMPTPCVSPTRTLFPNSHYLRFPPWPRRWAARRHRCYGRHGQQNPAHGIVAGGTSPDAYSHAQRRDAGIRATPSP